MTHEIVIEEMPEDKVLEISQEEDDDCVEEVEQTDDHCIEMVVEPIIVINDIPGAPHGTSDLVFEVESDDDEDSKESSKDSQKADFKLGPKSKWDWKASFPEGFVTWIKQRQGDVPYHTGYDLGGLERAVSYMERLDSEIGKAMRDDIDGDLDAEEIDKARKEIEKGIDLLEKRISNVKDSKKKKKASDDISDDGIIKTAQQSPGIKAGIVVTAPLFIFTLARMCINGTVSAGKDMEDLFKKASDKFKLDEREKYELRQLICDMGFPIRFDRMSFVGEEVDESSSENGDWSSNYGGKNQ